MANETTRAHLLASLGDIEGLASRLRATGPQSSGLALVRMMVDRRAFLADELAWADRRAHTADVAEVDVLTGYRLLLTKALVSTERMLAAYPVEDLQSAADAGYALGQLVALRTDVEQLDG